MINNNLEDNARSNSFKYKYTCISLSNFKAICECLLYNESYFLSQPQMQNSSLMKNVKKIMELKDQIFKVRDYH